MTINTVLLFYNKSTLTIRCFKELIEVIKHSRPDILHNILLVDNGSVKSQLEEVEKKVLEIKNAIKIDNLKSIFVSSIKDNAGFGSGMNHGLKKFFEENSDFTLTLSNDVYLDKDFFNNLSEREIPKESIICPHVYYMMDRSKQSYTHGEVIFTKDNLDLKHDFNNEINEIIFPKYYPAAAVVWTRDAFLKTSGFNEEFYCYWEDVDLALRCKELNVKILSDKKLKIFHLGRGTTSGKKTYSEHFEKGRQIIKNIVTSFKNN